MKNNQSLNDAEMESFATAATQHNIEKHLRSKYDKILADKKKNTPKKNSIFRLSTLIKVAAVAVIVIGSTLLFMQSDAFSSSSKTMAENFLAQTNIPGNPDYTRKGSVTAEELQKEANNLFVLKDYPAAIEKFEELKSSQGLSLMDQFYVGVSLMKIKNYQEAIPIFNSLKSAGNNPIEEVDWLLSLAHVLSDQSENAVPILQNIIAEDRYKSKEAKKLMSKIK